MPFGEYELSPSLIGLSLLPSPHPEAFQRLLVRPSIPCYRDFSLDKGRSLGFASASADYAPYSDSLSLRLRGSCPLTSPTTATRRIIMQKARRHPQKGAPTACRRTVSGSVALLCPRFFSPFPHGTGTLSVSCPVFSLAGWARRIHAGLHVSRATQDAAMLPEGSRTGLSPSAAALSGAFRSLPSCNIAVLQPPARLDAPGLGSSPFARHYWGNHSYFLFLRVLRCFSSPRMPPAKGGVSRLHRDGLSHSEIRGSTAICASPRLIAAYHVLHRWQEPRHPPYALSYFPAPAAHSRAARRISKADLLNVTLSLMSFL